MPNQLTRRQFGRGALEVIATGAAITALPHRPARATADAKTLRFIAQSDLRVLDPIWTTAYITRNHGYCVFDTLFAVDAEFEPHPQMVGDYSISNDKLTYRFKLRDGLAWHDGSPVRGADCVASLKRWAARDGHGQVMLKVLDTIAADAGTAFAIKLKEPFPLLIDALAKVSSLAPFMMPERLANTDPYQQVTEMVGSGPLKFVNEEFQPGHQVVYLKNTDYVPRQEPSDWASGGKVVKFERIEWLYIPDPTTKEAALSNGEADWWENPPPDIWPMIAADADLRLLEMDPLGAMGCLRFNHLLPPFDNVKMRQAVLAVISQPDIMTAYAGDPKNWKICPSIFTCGTAMSNDAGSAALTGKRDFAKAKQLIAEAGYKGEKIVVMDAVDQPLNHAEASVTADVLRKLGLNVELQAMDWGTLVTRRAKKDPIDKGGWNIFCTAWVGADGLDPIVNLPLNSSGDNAWFGWPTDHTIEALRAQWLKAATLDDRKKIAAEIQQRAFETVPYIPTGQWVTKTAYRQHLQGIITGPAFFMWSAEKA